MGKRFFDIVKDNFFRPLSGSTREVNYLILQMINEKMQDSLEYVDRNAITDWIIEFCQSRPKSIMVDDDTENQETDVKRFAANKIIYLEKAGWLSAERTNDFKVVYQLEPAAIEILNAMRNVESGESKPIEYTGYVYNIYSQLMNFNIDQGTIIIEQMLAASKKLNDSLRSINISIKKYLSDLLHDDSIDVNGILKILLEDYQNNVVSRAFYNLRTKDNPSRYRNAIINKLDELLYECLGRLTDDYIKVKFGGDRSGSNQNDAQEYIINSLSEIKEQFETIDDTIKILDARNTKYISTATARLRYLMNEGIDVEGKIYDILKSIEEYDIPDSEGFEFSLKEFGRIDNNSLSVYSHRKKRIAAKPVVKKPKIDIVDVEKERAKLLRQTQFSIINIDKYICEQLKGREYIEAKDVKVENYDDLIKLYLAQVYADSEHVRYKVEIKQELFKYGKSKLTNFIIRRK